MSFVNVIAVAIAIVIVVTHSGERNEPPVSASKLHSNHGCPKDFISNPCPVARAATVHNPVPPPSVVTRTCPRDPSDTMITSSASKFCYPLPSTSTQHGVAIENWHPPHFSFPPDPALSTLGFRTPSSCSVSESGIETVRHHQAPFQGCTSFEERIFFCFCCTVQS